jgi:hypothetical protein
VVSPLAVLVVAGCIVTNPTMHAVMAIPSRPTVAVGPLPFLRGCFLDLSFSTKAPAGLSTERFRPDPVVGAPCENGLSSLESGSDLGSAAPASAFTDD